MTPDKLAWGLRVSPEFRQRVFDLCYRLYWSMQHASWLMACMAFESAETFSPSITNAAGSGAVGLIQFMQKTAKSLGTSTDELLHMTAVEQLYWVEKYFKPYAPRIMSLPDMYMAILLPKYIGQPDDAVLFSDPNIGYRQNSKLDFNSDGHITKLEATDRVQHKLDRGMLPGNLWINN